MKKYQTQEHIHVPISIPLIFVICVMYYLNTHQAQHLSMIENFKFTQQQTHHHKIVYFIRNSLTTCQYYFVIKI